MLSFYRGLLYLYPSLYRREFASEMVCVFQDARADISGANFGELFSFRLREILGLLSGAFREHIRVLSGTSASVSFMRLDMRTEFRFPRSTVFLMAIIFAGVILAMEKANTIQLKYAAGVGSIWPSLPWFLVLAFLFTWAASLIILGVLFALGKSGAHRMANIESARNSIR